MSELSHLDSEGRARMVDVGGKAVTRRVAVASGRLDTTALVATVVMTVVAMALAVWRYDSGRILRRSLAAS